MRWIQLVTTVFFVNTTAVWIKLSLGIVNYLHGKRDS